MGTYDYETFYETFGGEPQPGEAHPSAETIDNARKVERENTLSGEPASPSSSRDGSASNDSKGLRANAPHSRHVTAGRSRCEVCGAGPDDDCAPGCETNR